MVMKMWRKGSPWCTVDKNANWGSTYGKQYLRKFKKLPHDSAVSLLGIYLKKIEDLTQKDTCTSTFIVALFTIAKIRRQPTCVSVDKENMVDST